jgi:hypothetical protein
MKQQLKQQKLQSSKSEKPVVLLKGTEKGENHTFFSALSCWQRFFFSVVRSWMHLSIKKGESL